MKMNTNCRLCNSKQIKKVIDFKESAPVDNFRPRLHDKININKYNMDVYICRSCGHVQLPFAIDPQIVFSDYIYESNSSPGLRQHFKKLYEVILSKKILNKNSLVLDIGCNDGLLLENFVKNKYTAVGVDPDKKSLKIANSKGIHTYNDYLNKKIVEKIKKRYGKFNLILATNVYSHSDDLIYFTKCVSNLLNYNGYFVFEVSYLKALLFSGVWDYVYHEHLAYHSLKPLNTFLKKFNLFIVDVEFLNVKGGSIRCFAQKKKSKFDIPQKIKKIIKKEINDGFYKINTFSNVINLKLNLKNKINSILNRKIFSNGLIASYGASATTTVLIQELGIASKISFIIDDNKNRQNTLSPGYLIPILDRKKLLKYNPKLLIISAWRFKKEILKNCESYVNKGGHILIPNPVIKLINKQNYEKEIKK